MLPVTRAVRMCPVVGTPVARSLSYSHRRQFISNLFGKKEVKQRQELIKNQDDFEIDPASRIVILNEENSPDHKPFDAAVDMPNFVIKKWKNKEVSLKDIESTYDTNLLVKVISESYQSVFQKPLSQDQFASASLSNLESRFEFAKLLQQNLGIDISDYTLSKSHTVGELFSALELIINTRWTNERNPNAIVLRPEDFTAPNVYLDQLRSEKAQKREYRKLSDLARAASP